MTDVKVGQTWQDWDVRYRGDRGYRRLGLVLAVDATHATVRWVCFYGDTQDGKPHSTRVRLMRFKPTSTGYKLIHDAPENDVNRIAVRDRERS